MKTAFDSLRTAIQERDKYLTILNNANRVALQHPSQGLQQLNDFMLNDSRGKAEHYTNVVDKAFSILQQGLETDKATLAGNNSAIATNQKILNDCINDANSLDSQIKLNQINLQQKQAELATLGTTIAQLKSQIDTKQQNYESAISGKTPKQKSFLAYKAIEQGKTKFLPKVLDSNFDPAYQNSQGQTLLHSVFVSGNLNSAQKLKIEKFLLKHGVNPETKDIQQHDAKFVAHESFAEGEYIIDHQDEIDATFLGSLSNISLD